MKKAERLNQELLYLRDKSFFQLKELMEEFSISKRTALRDVEELESMGLALYVETGRYGGYRKINQGPLIPVFFNDKEIQAIFFALNALHLVSSTPFQKSYANIQHKLFKTMTVPQQESISKMLTAVHYHNVAPVREIDNLEEILQAILEEKAVEMTYSQYEKTEVQIQMYELFYRNGIWFTSAYEFKTKQWGIYRCDYMSELRINEKVRTFTKEELKKLEEDYEQTYHDIPFRCRLTSFGKELFLKNNYPNMTLKIENNIPYIIGGYNQEELAYMTHYLISLGKHVIIEEPQQLKDSYKKQLKELLDKY